MPSYGIHWDEMDTDEQSQMRAYLQKEREKALASYPVGEDHRCCSYCGELLTYNSMAYHEGWHFDSCE